MSPLHRWMPKRNGTPWPRPVTFGTIRGWFVWGWLLGFLSALAWFELPL